MVVVFIIIGVFLITKWLISGLILSLFGENTPEEKIIINNHYHTTNNHLHVNNDALETFKNN